MRRMMEVVYLLHFLSIAVALVGGFRVRGAVQGVTGFEVNPNFAKRVLTHKRAVALGLWGILLTGLALAIGGMEFGFVAGRLPFPRSLPPAALLVYLLLMFALIGGALHPMVAIGYRLVPALMEKAGNLSPEEAARLVARLRLNAMLLTALILLALAAGALRWLYASGALF
jgi:hypothetical protein